MYKGMMVKPPLVTTGGFTQDNWMIPLAKWEYQTRWPNVKIDFLPKKNYIAVDDTKDNQLISTACYEKMWKKYVVNDSKDSESHPPKRATFLIRSIGVFATWPTPKGHKKCFRNTGDPV